MIFGSVPLPKKCNNRINFKLMKKIGFETIDVRDLFCSQSKIYNLSDTKFEKYFINLKRKLDKYALKAYQMHGMWDTDLFELDKPENWDKLVVYYEKAMKACSLLDCKYLVIHPRMPFGWNTTPEQYEYSYKNNLQFIKKILPTAIKHDITICLENMPSPYDFGKIDGIIKCIDEINSEHFKMCLDTGHYNISDNKLDIYSTLLKIGNRLKVLHVHDNNKDFDHHLLPGKGNIDWEMFIKGLKAINFEGPISFESESKEKNNKKKIEEELTSINLIQKYLIY